MTELQQTINFKDLATQLPCGIVLLNSQGKIEWLNALAQRWCQSQPGQLWRLALEQFLAPQPQDGDEVLLKTGQKIKVETTVLDGFNGQVIMLVDVTHSRSVQDRLNQEKRLQVLGNMSANLAHQIRNPLCAALLQLRTLQAKYKNESKLEKIQQNLKSIEHEVNSILLFSRSDKALVEPLSLKTLVMDAIAVSNIESKDIVIDFQNYCVDDCMVVGNQQALLGAVTNIISNAIEASGQKDCVEINLKTQADEVILEVADYGHGIEAVMLDQIFEPFYTTKAKGTGLGLSIAKSIINNHKGLLTIDSQLGQGTKVTIHLPKGST